MTKKNKQDNTSTKNNDDKTIIPPENSVDTEDEIPVYEYQIRYVLPESLSKEEIESKIRLLLSENNNIDTSYLSDKNSDLKELGVFDSDTVQSIANNLVLHHTIDGYVLSAYAYLTIYILDFLDYVERESYLSEDLAEIFRLAKCLMKNIEDLIKETTRLNNSKIKPNERLIAIHALSLQLVKQKKLLDTLKIGLQKEEETEIKRIQSIADKYKDLEEKDLQQSLKSKIKYFIESEANNKKSKDPNEEQLEHLVKLIFMKEHSVDNNKLAEFCTYLSLFIEPPLKQEQLYNILVEEKTIFENPEKTSNIINEKLKKTQEKYEKLSSNTKDNIKKIGSAIQKEAQEDEEEKSLIQKKQELEYKKNEVYTSIEKLFNAVNNLGASRKDSLYDIKNNLLFSVKTVMEHLKYFFETTKKYSDPYTRMFVNHILQNHEKIIIKNLDNISDNIDRDLDTIIEIQRKPLGDKILNFTNDALSLARSSLLGTSIAPTSNSGHTEDIEMKDMFFSKLPNKDVVEDEEAKQKSQKLNSKQQLKKE